MRNRGISIKNSPLIVKMFVTFTLFLIIPIITVGIMFNYYTISYTEREISKSVITNLKTIKNMNDILVDSVTRDVIRFSSNKALDDLNSIRDYYTLKGNADNLIKLSKVRDILRTAYNSNYRIHSIYVYQESANYIITSGEEGIVPKDEFKDMGWLAAYNEKKEGAVGTIWLNSRNIGDGFSKEDASEQKVITFVMPLKSISLTLDGAIVVNVSEKELSTIINNTDLAKSGYVFIMDSRGNVISHIDKSLTSKNISNVPYVKNIISSASNNGYDIDKNNKDKQIVAYNKTEMKDWIYVGVFSLNNLMDNVRLLRWKIGAIVLFLIILGVVMSYVISRKLYNPLEALVQTVKQRKGIDLKDDENEMALLSRAFNTIVRQETDLLDILEKNKVTLKERYLLNLLKGEIDGDAFKSDIAARFKYTHYICAILSIDKYKKFTESYSKDQQHYMKMLIMKLCEEVISNYYCCETILYDINKVTVIVNVDTDEKNDVFKYLDKGYKKVQEELLKVFDNTVTISMGDCHTGELGVFSSFSEALEGMKQKYIYGYGKVMLWKDSEIKENEYYYPIKIEKHIMNNLTIGQKKETLDAVKELFANLRSRTNISSDNILQIFIQLIGTTVKYLMDNNINISDIFGHDYNIYQSLSSKETLDDAEEWIMRFYNDILDYANKSDKEVKDHADRVFQFIRNNLKNNIDVTAIADNAGISYSYVRKIVKDKSGKTVLDYINSIRIEEAKRLLRESNMSMIDIALQVGYNNYQSFNRFFQKYEGITPGEFRSAE
jgi:AraC-like DNA-binding protein